MTPLKGALLQSSTHKTSVVRIILRLTAIFLYSSEIQLIKIRPLLVTLTDSTFPSTHFTIFHTSNRFLICILTQTHLNKKQFFIIYTRFVYSNLTISFLLQFSILLLSIQTFVFTKFTQRADKFELSIHFRHLPLPVKFLSVYTIVFSRPSVPCLGVSSLPCLVTDGYY